MCTCIYIYSIAVCPVTFYRHQLPQGLHHSPFQFVAHVRIAPCATVLDHLHKDIITMHNFNNICIAWILNHCKNNAIQRKIDDICIAWMLNQCKNKAILVKSMIYVLPGLQNIVKTTLFIIKSMIYVLPGC